MGIFTDIIDKKNKPKSDLSNLIDIPKRGLVDGPGSYGGVKYNLKALGGEGNRYIKTYDTKDGEKRYLADFSREGFNRKSAQPYTEDGLKKARKKVKEFEKEYRDKFGFGIRKGEKPVNPSVTKAKLHPPGKPWKYRMPVKQKDGTTKLVSKYYKSEAKAKAAMEKIRKKKFKGQEVSYKDKLPEIKRLLRAGKTQREVSKAVKIPFGAVPRALKKIGKKMSDYQPETYLYDEKLKKRFIKDYRKLSRLELAKKLFPEDKIKSADAKYGHLGQKIFEEGRLVPKKRGELSQSLIKKRPPKKTKPEADRSSKKVRGKKLTKLGSKRYENSLTKFKTEIGRLLGIKEIKGPKTSFIPLDLSHRSDIRLLSRLGDQKITPGDLGLEFTEANRRGIRKYKFGVKTLERKLEPLYAQQKRLFNKVGRDGMSKSLSNLIEQNNDKIDNLFKKSNPVIASKLNPILMNAETGEPFRITPSGGKTLFEIGKPLQDVELGGLDDFLIKRSYANQIVQVAKEEGLLDITDKEAQKIIDKYFEDANTRTPIKTVKRTVGGKVFYDKRGTEGYVPNENIVQKEVLKTFPETSPEVNQVKMAIAKLSTNKVCAVGGRKPMNTGGNVSGLDQCFKEGLDALKKRNINKPHQIQGAKQLMNAGKKIGANKFVNILTNLGVVGEAVFIAGDIGIRQAMGRPFYEAFLAATFREGRADRLRQERAGVDPEVIEANKIAEQIDSINAQIKNVEALGDFYNEADMQVLLNKKAELEKQLEPLGQYLEPTSAKNISSRIREAETIDSDLAKSVFTKARARDNELGIPNIADYGEIDAGVSEVRPKERSVLPNEKEATINYLSTMYGDLAPLMYDSLSEEQRKNLLFYIPGREEQIYGFNPDKSLTLPKTNKRSYIPSPQEEEEREQLMSEVQGAKDGGLMNLTRTTPPKRSLNKDSQGLASLPEYDR